MDFSTLTTLIIPISIGGILSGIIAGLFGVGGGIILVPSIVFTLEFLNYDQSITMHIAVATSLALIIPTAISSSQKGSLSFSKLIKLTDASKRFNFSK